MAYPHLVRGEGHLAERRLQAGERVHLLLVYEGGGGAGGHADPAAGG